MVFGVLSCVLLATALYIKINEMRYGERSENDQPERFCAEVITPARNLKTGEIKDFPNTCLPNDWERLAPKPINQ
jgi:hypothetical protein